VWNVPPPSLAALAWEKQLAVVVGLTVKYNAQVADHDKAQEELDYAKFIHSKELSLLNDMYYDLEAAKAELKALPLA